MNRKQPLYLNLRQYIIDAIIDGKYVEGDFLPSVRAMALEQGANPLTVAKAYQFFQDANLVAVQRGVGLKISSGARQKLKQTEREKFIQEIWPKICRKMDQLNLNIEDLNNISR
ncbi:GntR family transcriptional regulator [Sphingorhabdus lutea]|uniref:GntR family transcriptional regulator n=1 Tax=Sphingorhabdus lutea TaxID=1913578 RepID=A0A1L3JCT6_9SPHN|nr:GntR family transcriptional regulator [Sphingorhabdus lutea]APG62951.1 GntR family transcriptional regulator [Sphingorhabdus lutea]